MDFKQHLSKDNISLSDSFSNFSEDLPESGIYIGSSEESAKHLFSYYINFEPDFQALVSQELDHLAESPE